MEQVFSNNDYKTTSIKADMSETFKLLNSLLSEIDKIKVKG
jgi:hypothetical protein